MKRIISRINCGLISRIDRCTSQIESIYLSLFISRIQPRLRRFFTGSKILESSLEAERPIKFFINMWKRIVCTRFLSHWHGTIIIEAKVLFFAFYSFLLYFFLARWKICKLVYTASEEKRKLPLEHRAAITYLFHENRIKDRMTILSLFVSSFHSFSIRSSVLNVIPEITIIYELSFHGSFHSPHKCLFTYYLLNRSLSLNYFHGSISVIDG